MIEPEGIRKELNGKDNIIHQSSWPGRVTLGILLISSL